MLLASPSKSSAVFAPIGLALCLLGTGCSDLGPTNVTSSYGPGFRFTDRHHTYVWAPGSEKLNTPGRPQNAETDGLIREAIERRFAAKGYAQATTTAPDFQIDYRIAREMRADPYVGVGFPQYAEGSLLIYVINPTTQQLSWRGCIEARLDESAPPEVRLNRLDTAVKLILDQMPDYKPVK
jgi:hypothetical protein